nr:odorant binding protein 4 [Sogatella furcifera]
MCCDLPLVYRGTPELFKACREELGFPDHKPPPPPPSSDGHGPHGHPQRGMCVAECLFNRTGLLENGKINKEALKKALDEYLKTDGAWKDVATTTLEICYDAQTRGDFKPDNEKFTSGSSEFLKCFTRNLFMDCIPEKWTDSEECKKMKEKIDKCPKMLPPALFNKRPH